MYFIVSLNQTQIYENNDHHYDHENYNPIRMLRFFNVSETEVNVSDIPAATEFQAVVYLVALNNDIYKSERLTIKSAEGGKKLKCFYTLFEAKQLWLLEIDGNIKMSYPFDSSIRQFHNSFGCHYTRCH